MTTYTEMLTHAHAIKKPTKRQAWEILHEAAWAGEHLSEEALTKLIAYFMPSVPKAPKTDLEWIASAIDIAESRETLRFAHAHDGKMYGTDGHRLHWAPTNMPDGFYSPMTGERITAPIGTFPNVERVIPERQAGIELGMPDLTIADKDSEGRTLAQLPNGGHVNLAYLQAATLGKPATFHLRGPNDSIRLEMAGDRGAVILPVRV